MVYCRQAGKKAAARSANREAVTYFEQALGVLKHLPLNRVTLTLGVDLRLELRPSLLTLGEQERIVEHLSQAESLAEELGDKRRIGCVLADMSAYFSREGEDYRAVSPGERALAIATELGDFGLQVIALDRLSRVYMGLGEYRRAIALCERSTSLLEGKPVGERFGMASVASVVTRIPLVLSLAELGGACSFSKSDPHPLFWPRTPARPRAARHQAHRRDLSGELELRLLVRPVPWSQWTGAILVSIPESDGPVRPSSQRPNRAAVQPGRCIFTGKSHLHRER